MEPEQIIKSPEPRTMDDVAAAEFLGLAPRTLQAWRGQKKGPRYLSYSKRCVRYRVADLIKWQESVAQLQD